jgi:hypothetical protein
MRSRMDDIHLYMNERTQRNCNMIVDDKRENNLKAFMNNTYSMMCDIIRFEGFSYQTPSDVENVS